MIEGSVFRGADSVGIRVTLTDGMTQTNLWSSEFGTPSLAQGAWFHADATRMDDQQHALSGLQYAADMAANRVRREP